MPATVYKAHPLCAAFPKMNDVEFTELRIDIKTHGLRVPIVLFEGMVLDGGHRYSACLDVGVEPRFSQFTGDDPATFVMSMNYKRRSMSASQRALVVAELAPRLEAEAAKRKAAAGAANLAKATAPPSGYTSVPTRSEASPTVAEALEAVGEAAGIIPPAPPSKSKPGRTRERVAELAQVGPTTAQAAIDVVKHAPPETVEAVRSGATSVKEAAREVRGKAKGNPSAKASAPTRPEQAEEAAAGPVCSQGVRIDAARVQAFELYLERHKKGASLCKQLVEVVSDILEAPFGELLGPASAYETQRAGDRDRLRHKTLERMREFFHTSSKPTTCPTCKGKGCKACRFVGVLPTDDLAKFPADQKAELAKLAKECGTLEPLGKEAEALWVAKHGPLPAAPAEESAKSDNEGVPF